MNRKVMLTALVVLGVTALWAGVAVSGQEEEKQAAPSAMPLMPPPPPQLRALNDFIGQWKGTYEFLPAMMGQPGQGTGVSDYEWVLDGRFVMIKMKGTGSFGDYEMITMMTYDVTARTYRSYGFDNMGMVDIADGAYDAGAKTWTFTSDSMDMMGKPAKSKYVTRLAGPDKMEWQWSQKSEGRRGLQRDDEGHGRPGVQGQVAASQAGSFPSRARKEAVRCRRAGPPPCGRGSVCVHTRLSGGRYRTSRMKVAPSSGL